MRRLLRAPSNISASLVLCALAVGVGITAGPSPRLDAAPAATIAVRSDSFRVYLQSRFLQLELNLRQPSLDVIRYAPSGDEQYGVNIGSLVEEASAANQQLRSWSSDGDGARVSWLNTPDGVMVRLEGIDTGQLARSTWILNLPADSPTLQINRFTRLGTNQPVERVGLVMIGQRIPEGTDPASLAPLLNGSAYRLEVGPSTLEQNGGTFGLLAVDNPELSYSARTDQPDQVVARQEGNFTTLAFSRRVSAQQRGGELRESIDLRFGWDNEFLKARSDFNPTLETRLLASGYYGNAVFSPLLGTVLSASMRDYRGSVWSRDVDYALQGYSYVLSDMSVFRNVIAKFLERVDAEGIAPEYILLNGEYGNRETWDSMANVVQSMYTYVAKTGDLDFYREYEPAVKRALNWIRELDTDGDGLPDRDIFPYGYTDTVENGPMHTYAIAKHYQAFLAVAELEELIGHDATLLREYAATMQASFRLPLAEGGYWNPDTGYPIAWKRDSGLIVTEFETFGIFEAIRVGLLTDPVQLQSIARWLDANRGAFLNGNSYPERLIIGGYDVSVKKSEVPDEKLWIMDCNAPWITGISVPARARLGRVQDAAEMLGIYADSADRRTPHAEFGAGPAARYGAGETEDGGRLWDNWSWFNAIYGTHFGLRMTPGALEIAPVPLHASAGRRLENVTYQGARVRMELLPDGYSVQLDGARELALHPPYGFRTIEVNRDGNIQTSQTLTTTPGMSYVIRAYR